MSRALASPALAEGPAAERLRNLVQKALPGAQIVRVELLGPDSSAKQDSEKGAGYGAPLRIDLWRNGAASSVVLRTATPNQFGHDRRADRAAAAILAADTFASVARHVSVLDVGAYRGESGFVSLAETGEFYLLTDYVPGRVYAEDLREIARAGAVTERDVARSRTLADYLARLHTERPAGAATAYTRFVRDTLGSGEGIFGIVDGYPDDVPGAPRSRLERIEERCLSWRFRLRKRQERLRRTHGDFHPFNVLFDEASNLTLLDTSRGSLGDPGDDVACMAINFAFFSLGRPNAWRGALRSLWHGFFRSYLEATHDDGLYDVVAPLLAWRGLVLASPVWYPKLAPEDRERILAFVERSLDVPRFDPALAEEFFDT